MYFYKTIFCDSISTKGSITAMAIKYDKLFSLIKERRKSEYYLRKNGISPSILDKLKRGTGGLDARTIEKLCRLLDCQPGDIMEFVQDAEDTIGGSNS